MLSIAIFVLHFPLASVHHAYAHYEDGGPFSFDPKAADYNNQFISHQAPILVLENVRVIDGMGSAPEEAQTIVIEDGKIIALGATGSIPIPKDAKVISAAGKTVLPGYVMHHEHLYYHSLSQVPGMPYLATPSMVTRLALEPLQGIDKDILLRPDLFLTAPFIQGDPEYYQLMPEINSAEAAKREVRYWAERGFHNFKTCVDISLSEIRAAAQEAHLHGKNISSRLCSVSILEALDAGIDEIEHEFQSIAVDILPLNEGEEIYSKAGDVTIFLQKLMELDYKFWKAGGNLVMGSDAVALAGAVPGSTNLESLELLFMAGIPPLEVIKIATLNGARALDLFNRRTIAEGQRADLILLNGNPVEDFKAIYEIGTVSKKGVGYSSARLQDTIGIIN
ncbi:hypothetical protein V2G26_011305 [Clonostachys chloroleuca]